MLRQHREYREPNLSKPSPFSRVQHRETHGFPAMPESHAWRPAGTR
ncbi:hypothetical protein HMPREF0731_0427 [Pseudoroseomonas cervicalis ATCC 49957]|uniref:Uncharacterized protein n=1 Tax=Pseudoroseomonas cervicalis ATCC 49957 TaxID=525371 RepID=D5RH68_9PROT|nr:hypothetical protein HMPREF0731_0427 [Pseudoroseomonas cervicalis ATCC 49957]